MISKANLLALAAVVLVLVPVACRKQEQAVVGVAQNAVSKAEEAANQAKAAADERDRQRAALASIPLPTKSLYRGVREASAWANPFLSVDSDATHLRVAAAPAANGQAHGAHAQTQQQDLQTAELAKALIALPPTAWKYGRVVAVAEAPADSRKDRAQLRRNLEAVIQQLNDLGIVVEEWPLR